MNSDVGRERGRERKTIGRLALRGRLASLCSKDRVRQTDCLSRAPREGGSANAQAHKGPSGWWRGREAVELRRPAQAQELSLRALAGKEGQNRLCPAPGPVAGVGRAPRGPGARGVAKNQAPPTTAAEVGGGLRLTVASRLFL